MLIKIRCAKTVTCNYKIRHLLALTILVFYLTFN